MPELTKEQKRFINQKPDEVKDNNDIESSEVIRTLDVIDEGEEIYDDLLEDYERIKDQYNEGLSVEKPGEMKGGKIMHSKYMYTRVNKLYQKLTFIGYSINPTQTRDKVIKGVRALFENMAKRQGKGKQEVEGRIQKIIDSIGIMDFAKTCLEKGIHHALKKSGIYEEFQGEEGVFFDISLYGSSLVLIKDGDKDNPILAEKAPIDRVYVNSSARVMRGKNGKSVTRFVVIYDFEDVDELISILPEDEQKIVKEIQWGNIPTRGAFERLLRETDMQHAQRTNTRGIQMALSWDIEDPKNPKFTKIVGGHATIIKELKGSDYLKKWKKSGDAYIPVCSFKCFPNTEGFFSKGMGHYSSQPHSCDNIIRNGTLRGIMAEVNKMFVIDLEESEINNFQLRMNKAQYDQDKYGKLGVIPNPVKNGEPAYKGIRELSPGFTDNSRTLAENIFQDDEVALGINMTDVMMSTSKKVGLAELEASAQQALPDMIERLNASEYKFLIEIVGEKLKNISKDNESAVDFSKVLTEDEILNNIFQNITIGDISCLAKEFGDIDIDPVFTNPITPEQQVKIGQLTRILNATSGAQPELASVIVGELIKAHGYNIELPKPEPQQEQGQPQGVPQLPLPQ